MEKIKGEWKRCKIIWGLEGNADHLDWEKSNQKQGVVEEKA